MSKSDRFDQLEIESILDFFFRKLISDWFDQLESD